MDELGMSSVLTLSKSNFSLKLYRLYKYIAQVGFFNWTSIAAACLMLL